MFAVSIYCCYRLSPKTLEMHALFARQLLASSSRLWTATALSLRSRQHWKTSVNCFQQTYQKRYRIVGIFLGYKLSQNSSLFAACMQYLICGYKCSRYMLISENRKHLYIRNNYIHYTKLVHMTQPVLSLIALRTDLSMSKQ